MEFNIFSDSFYPLDNSCKFIDVSPVGPDASSVGLVMMYKAIIELKTE